MDSTRGVMAMKNSMRIRTHRGESTTSNTTTAADFMPIRYQHRNGSVSWGMHSRTRDVISFILSVNGDSNFHGSGQTNSVTRIACQETSSPHLRKTIVGSARRRTVSILVTQESVF